MSRTTRVCAFDRAGEGWSGGKAVRRGRSPAGVRPARAPAGRACSRAVCPRRPLRRRHLRARLRRALSDAGRRGRADRLRNALSVRPSGLPLVLLDVQARLGAPAGRRPHSHGPDRAAERVRFTAAACARRRTRVQLLAASADSQPDRVPATADGLQPGESPAQPPRQAAHRPERERRRDAGWAAAQDKLARLSTNSTHRTVAGASHAALLEDKSFATITSDAITQVVRRVRSDRH